MQIMAVYTTRIRSSIILSHSLIRINCLLTISGINGHYIVYQDSQPLAGHKRNLPATITRTRAF